MNIGIKINKIHLYIRKLSLFEYGHRQNPVIPKSHDCSHMHICWKHTKMWLIKIYISIKTNLNEFIKQLKRPCRRVMGVYSLQKCNTKILSEIWFYPKFVTLENNDQAWNHLTKTPLLLIIINNNELVHKQIKLTSY